MSKLDAIAKAPSLTRTKNQDLYTSIILKVQSASSFKQ